MNLLAQFIPHIKDISFSIHFIRLRAQKLRFREGRCDDILETFHVEWVALESVHEDEEMDSGIRLGKSRVDNVAHLLFFESIYYFF